MASLLQRTLQKVEHFYDCKVWLQNDFKPLFRNHFSHNVCKIIRRCSSHFRSVIDSNDYRLLSPSIYVLCIEIDKKDHSSSNKEMGANEMVSTCQVVSVVIPCVTWPVI